MNGFKNPIFAANYFITWEGIIKPDARSEKHALKTKSSLNTKDIVKVDFLLN